ncbi:MAG: hypothetical protein RSC87_10135, partial [Muribaculaceae bacterium]
MTKLKTSSMLTNFIRKINVIFITNNLVVSGNCANTHSYLIDTFPTVREAQLNAIQAGASKEQMQKLIEK